MSMEQICPPVVAKGDTVGIVATSSPVSEEQLGRIVDYFSGRGHKVCVSREATHSWGYLAGSKEKRSRELEAMFQNPEVRLIVPANGGKGASHLLDLLDFDLIRENPKIFTGVSDPSVLCNAIYTRSGLVTLHGPTGVDFFQETVNADTESAFWEIVSGPVTGREVVGEDWKVYRANGRNSVSGHVLGGHLGTFQALVGTPWMPSLTGAVLLLEEVVTPWARIDAMLTHLRLAGVFDSLSAVLFGTPVECERDEAADKTLDDLVLRCIPEHVTVVTNVDFGHTPRKIPLPVGGKVMIDLTDREPVLRYLSDLVSI